MPRPNSPLTRIRFYLVRFLDPFPDKGEAWCIGCALNDGRTLIVPATGHSHHIDLHRGEDGTTRSNIAIRVNWGHAPPSYNEDED